MFRSTECRQSRILLLAGTLVANVSGCGSSITANCEIQRVDVVFAGIIDRGASSQSVIMTSTFDTLLISRENFEFLASVLGRGAPTGSSSAVWGVTGTPPGGALIFQLAGSRQTGQVVPAVDAFFPGLPPGEGPPLSLSPPAGFRVLFVLDDYRAATATGTLTVSRAAPLRGNLSLDLSSSSGEQILITGELTVSITGQGCS